MRPNPSRTAEANYNLISAALDHCRRIAAQGKLLQGGKEVLNAYPNRTSSAPVGIAAGAGTLTCDTGLRGEACCRLRLRRLRGDSGGRKKGRQVLWNASGNETR